MIDRIRGLFSPDSKPYAPSLSEIEKELGTILTDRSMRRDLRFRLLTLSGLPANSKLSFKIERSERYGGSVKITTPERIEPILTIGPNDKGDSLIAISKNVQELVFWKVPFEKVGGRSGLYEAVRQLVFGEAPSVTSDLAKGSSIGWVNKGV